MEPTVRIVRMQTDYPIRFSITDSRLSAEPAHSFTYHEAYDYRAMALACGCDVTFIGSLPEDDA